MRDYSLFIVHYSLKVSMATGLTISVIITYFGILLLIAAHTAKNSNTQNFFLAQRQTPWYIVAFGMIGASLSGITFISIPGAILNAKFSYLQVVFGYLLGYFVIATVLMPLYYRLQLVSIYTYLEQRLGLWSYKTGAFFFLLSRIVSASFQLFVAASILQIGIFDSWNVPFWLTACVSVFLVFLYTFQGGQNTIVWTDIFQTAFMLLAAIITVFVIQQHLNLTVPQLVTTVTESPYSQIFFWEINDPRNFFKQFFGGACIAIAMTGLDQSMMQKNLTCKTLPDAQKNIFWFCVLLLLVNLLFLSLGTLLYAYAEAYQIALPKRTDDLYPLLAFQYLGGLASMVFVLGIMAATYSTIDSVLNSLTTSFCIDFLNIYKVPPTPPAPLPEGEGRRAADRQTTVKIVHLGFSILLVILIILFRTVSEGDMITRLLKAISFTYGPLLGLYAFGLLTSRPVRDRLVPLVCLLPPIFCFILHEHSAQWLGGYKFGFEILILNGLLTFLGLLLVSTKTPAWDAQNSSRGR